MTVSSQSVIPSVSHKSCSNTEPLPGSMRKGAATATVTATLVHDVTVSSLPTGNVPVFQNLEYFGITQKSPVDY